MKKYSLIKVKFVCQNTVGERERDTVRERESFYLLTVKVSIISSSRSSNNMSPPIVAARPKKIIIDTDPGIGMLFFISFI